MKIQKSRILGTILLAVLTVVISFAVFSYENSSVVLSYENGGAVNTFAEIFVSEDIKVNPMLSKKNSLIILSPSADEFSTDTPVVSIIGYCLPDKPLQINSSKINIEKDGSFKLDISLEIGENVITLTNGDLSFTYRINYNFSVIKSISQQSDITVNSDMVLNITAVALGGAKVYAKIGNATVDLKCDNTSNDVFKTYSADYIVPKFGEDRAEIGNIKFYSELGDHKEEKIGGKITVLKPISEFTVKSGKGTVIAPETLSDNTVKLLSPNEDHSYGTAQMCIVKKNYAEVVPASTADDRNDPRYTPYLSGTVDYITGECEFDNQEYFTLLSGVKIAKENTEVFTGYIMPMNTASNLSTSDKSLTLTMNWKVPFLSQLKQQGYYIGHASRAFNVKGFTATYIDFVFKYTNAVSQESISFRNNSVVSYAQWLNVGENGTSTLRVFLKAQGSFYGYKAYYSQDNRLVISFKDKPSANKKVVIDAGHGGKDCGAVGANGIYESKVNINIANEIKKILEQNGIKVEFTRQGDSFLSLDERQDFARASGADLFIALHNNSSEDSSLSGTEVYYYSAFSQPLAALIHSHLVNEWKTLYLNNSLMYDKIIPNDGGVRFFPFQVIRIEECPAVLVECGYLSNPTECKILCSSETQQRMAKAVSDGVMDYYKNIN